jgi:proline iminopeptidase
MLVPVKETTLNNDKIDVATIYCEISDEASLKDGRPVLFLIPGGPGFDHMIYKSHSQAFEEFAHVVYIDPRGSGKSSACKKEVEYEIKTNIYDIEAVREHLGIDKIHLLGTSYGSMVVQGYAIQYPERVAGLVLIAGAPSAAFLPVAKHNLAQRGTLEQQKVCDELLWPGNFQSQEDLSRFFQLMSPLYSVKSQKASNTSSQAAPYSKVNVCFYHGNAAFKNSFWNFDFTDKLKNIQCRTLIIFGESDWVNDPSFAKQIAKKIPTSELHILADCGHSVAVDQPQQYYELVKNLVTSRNEGLGVNLAGKEQFD